MDARFHRARQALLASSLGLLLVGITGLPVSAQSGDLCSLITPDELSAVVPGTYAPAGMEGTCQWTGTTDAGGGVIVIAYVVPGSATDMPGAEIVDIDGRPAFSAGDPSMEVPTHVVGVETDAGLLVLSVSVDDEAVDVPTATLALAGSAVARFEGATDVAPSSPSPSGAAPASVAPAASQPVATGSVCDLATPQEVAAAVGLDVELAVQDMGIACSWDALTDDGYVLVYAARQEPIAFEAILASLGAEEIEGPGEEDWWASSLASLFSRQGDLVLQVSYTSSEAPAEDELRARSIALMEALLTP